MSMAFRALAPNARMASVNGSLGFIVFSGARPFAVLGITYRGDTIAEIDVLADPDRLARLDLSALAAGR